MTWPNKYPYKFEEKKNRKKKRFKRCMISLYLLVENDPSNSIYVAHFQCSIGEFLDIDAWL
jgi:hypothetical protein